MYIYIYIYIHYIYIYIYIYIYKLLDIFSKFLFLLKSYHNFLILIVHIGLKETLYESWRITVFREKLML